MVLAWHTNIASGGLDPQLHEVTSAEDVIIFAVGLAGNSRRGKGRPNFKVSHYPEMGFLDSRRRVVYPTANLETKMRQGG
jgi:hypothetical protein